MKGLLLCGGYGTRLGALCRELPKPLLKVAGLSLAEHALARFGEAGIREVFVNLHYRGEQIRRSLGSGERFGVALRYIEEDTLLGTAGTARSLRTLCAGEPLLVHYGDVLSAHPLAALAEHHGLCRGTATLVVHKRPGSNSCVVFDSEGRVQRFVERPSAAARAQAGSDWAFSGLCVLSARCLQDLPAALPSDLPRDVFAPLAPQGLLFAQRHSGCRYAIDSPCRLERARNGWRGGMESTNGPRSTDAVYVHSSISGFSRCVAGGTRPPRHWRMR